MPDVNETIAWDFLTLVDWWNLYGLPLLLLAIAIGVLVRSWSRRVAGRLHDASRTVFLVGLIHCVLAVRGLISLIQELLTIRLMGIPESHISLNGALFRVVVNAVLAVGLLRRRPWARRCAIGWYAILSLLAILVVAWRYYYRVATEVATWPEQMMSTVLPFYLFAVMLVPRIKRVFAAQPGDEAMNPQPSNIAESAPGAAEASVRWQVVALPVLLFLIVACSNLVVDLADWSYRLVREPDSVP